MQKTYVAVTERCSSLNRQPYLGSFCEDQLRVLHQALQGHGDVDNLRLFVPPALVIDKFPVPGIHHNQTCMDSKAPMA